NAPPSEENGTHESDLLGGTYTSARPEVGKFNISPSIGGGFCTGTLISPTTFVTAAHCISHLPQNTGGSFTVEGFGDVAVQRAFSQGRHAPANDGLAYGHLASAVPSWAAAPASLGTSLSSGTWITDMGYGCTNNRNGNCTGGGAKQFRT